MEEMEKREQIDGLIIRLGRLRKALFLWQMGLEYIKSDSAEDIAAVFGMLTEQLKIIEEKLTELKS